MLVQQLIYSIKSPPRFIRKEATFYQWKYYVVDHGLREAVYGHNARDIDQILENIVCLELLRRGYTVTIGKAGNFEVDFIAEKGKRKCYVQVTYLLASPETIEREFRVYKDIKDNYPKYVVSMDELDFSQDGIQHYNIRNFCNALRIIKYVKNGSLLT